MTKSVRTTDRQDEYLERANINFSEWVRDRLNEKMEREHYGTCIVCNTDVYVTAGRDISPNSPIGDILGLTSHDETGDGRIPICEKHYNQALEVFEHPAATSIPNVFVPDTWTSVPDADQDTLSPDNDCTPHEQYTGTTPNDAAMRVSLEYNSDGDVWVVFSTITTDDESTTYHSAFSQHEQAIGHALTKLRRRGRDLPRADSLAA
ncbi:hypothetical protein [Salinibaculum rarum]|uniref:hypothetical protein n=1 Tax=Salinibaculum rarum TaxID=3058903 RepID=UPI00265F9C97|nr:hypothetical protein [Salinibaculum sp. KK48]